jgi:Cu(I)/Ag(I) efflux system membrane fusion protein
MKKPVVIAAGVLLLLSTFLAGSWYQKWRLSGNPPAGGRLILYYVDPMHPAYKSDKPGIAPDCGMKLEPVYADGGGPVTGASGDSASLAPGTVRISAERQQLIGVKVGSVEKRKISQQIRVLGRIAVDETRIYQIRSVVNGWIRDTSSVAAGSLVKKDEILASFYSPEFLGAEQAYIFALGALDRFVASGNETPQQLALTDANIQQYKDSLINLGMSDMQVDEIAKTRQRTQKIYIVAPASGFILARNVSLNQRFERGTELFKIADLSRVWILADIFENEAQFLSPGVVAKVTLPYQNMTFTARVGNTLPQFDPVSRTLKVRLEAENPGFFLKPDMFVDVDLQINYLPAIAVPVDAVVDTGLRKVVFVDLGNGAFEPRRVETGWRRGGLVEITRGLMDKERIVVSGTFMIDSESRMQAAAMGIYDEGVMDPVCGMYIDEKKAKASGRTIRYGGTVHYFCSPECMQDFEKNPRRYQEGSGEHRKQAAAAKTAPTDTHNHHD